MCFVRAEQTLVCMAQDKLCILKPQPFVLKKAWAFGTNANLPDDISVSWAKVVDDEFHARFSATARRYRYILYCNKLRSAILPEGITHCHLDLDEKENAPSGAVFIGRK